MQHFFYPWRRWEWDIQWLQAHSLIKLLATKVTAYIHFPGSMTERLCLITTRNSWMWMNTMHSIIPVTATVHASALSHRYLMLLWVLWPKHVSGGNLCSDRKTFLMLQWQLWSRNTSWCNRGYSCIPQTCHAVKLGNTVQQKSVPITTFHTAVPSTMQMTQATVLHCTTN